MSYFKCDLSEVFISVYFVRKRLSLWHFVWPDIQSLQLKRIIESRFAIGY